ncbi:MAG: type II toxin-antitoxin system RelE/ParE family toxin [Parachlamydiaceae bacterium]|nr:type II toxin-antitoxin system RelE/ParE family toxin [Parachlamydiaceae bacterium]
MRYKVELRPKATKFLNSIQKADKEKIEKKLEELSLNPRNEHVIKLSGMSPDQYRARQGDYKILFTIEDEKLIVEVIDIKNRQDAYKK